MYDNACEISVRHLMNLGVDKNEFSFKRFSSGIRECEIYSSKGSTWSIEYRKGFNIMSWDVITIAW